jgi:hypothetical protein
MSGINIDTAPSSSHNRYFVLKRKHIFQNVSEAQKLGPAQSWFCAESQASVFSLEKSKKRF